MVNQNSLEQLQRQPHIISFLATAVNEKINFLKAKSSLIKCSAYQERMFLKFDSIAKDKKLFLGNDTELQNLLELRDFLKAI